MKVITFIFTITVFSCTLARASSDDGLIQAIKKTRVASVKGLLQTCALTQQEKNELLDVAHETVCIKKAKLGDHSHNIGLKRKIIGFLWLSGGILQLVRGELKYTLAGFVNLAIGTNIYNAGTKAAKQKSVQHKAHTIQKYEAAIAIEKLISNATTSDTPTK